MTRKQRRVAGFVFTAVILLLGSGVATGGRGLDRRALAAYEQVKKKISPTAQRELDTAVKQFEREVSRSPKRANYHDLAKRTAPRPEGLTVHEAAYLVLIDAWRNMDDDIQMIMREIKAMTAAKQKLRDMIKDTNEWISNEMSEQSGSEGIDNRKVSSGLKFQQSHTPHYRIAYPKTPLIRSPAGLKNQSLPRLQREKSIREKDLAKIGEVSEDLEKGLRSWTDRLSKMERSVLDLLKEID